MTGMETGVTRIHQGKAQLRPLVKSLIDIPVKPKRSMLTSRIIPTISMDRLQVTNIVLQFNGEEPKCAPTTQTNTHANEILFSAISKYISTNASAGTSYIFTCSKTRLAAAIQLPSISSSKTSKHIDMNLIALANIRYLTPRDRITVYICGMTAMKGQFYFADDQKLMHDRLILKSVIYELNSLGVNAEVFFGEHYSKQIWDMENCKYDPGMRRH